jgi:hypothetical protein
MQLTVSFDFPENVRRFLRRNETSWNSAFTAYPEFKRYLSDTQPEIRAELSPDVSSVETSSEQDISRLLDEASKFKQSVRDIEPVDFFDEKTNAFFPQDRKAGQRVH